MLVVEEQCGLVLARAICCPWRQGRAMLQGHAAGLQGCDSFRSSVPCRRHPASCLTLRAGCPTVQPQAPSPHRT